MSEKITINSIDNPQEFQEYSSKDLNLIQQFKVSTQFGNPEDYIEYHIYDLNNKLIFSNLNSLDYKPDPSGNNPAQDTTFTLDLDPKRDLSNAGITRGTATVTYNFFTTILGSNQASPYWIKEISTDRTELKVSSQNLGSEEILNLFADYQIKTSTRAYFSDFLLNFGNNITLIGVNLAAAVDTDDDVVLYVKLYEPLPFALEDKSTFWFVEKLSEPTSFAVNIQVFEEAAPDTTLRLRGPNLSVAVNERINQTVQEYSYETLFSAPISSSYQQIKSLLEEKGVEINVDYSQFENFAHFSSVTERVYNFKYKLQLIESYSADLYNLDNNVVATANTAILGSTKEVIQSKINNIIEKFDGYEYYLYYESGSTTWPKYTSEKIYELYSVTSSQAINWLGAPSNSPTATSLSILYSASRYDNENKDLFLNTIPTYLRDDSDNLPYETFLDMVGQHFDNIWIYLKDVTQKFNANNSLTRGISKDLIANTLKGLGINLYTNTNISDNVYYSILGFNADGSLLPPTGSEVIQYYVTSSESTMAAEDITLEYYKRIYHNLPYLLKTKGTERGLRALINCYGLPDTILRINEYGGVIKNSIYSGYKENRFSLAYSNDFTSSIAFPWAPSYYTFLKTGNANIVPDAIEFRFKTKGVPEAGYYEQSLFQVGSDANLQFGLGLHYDPSTTVPKATVTSSYENYGYLTFYLNGGSGVLETTPIYLPFFDDEKWWTVLLQRETGSIAATPSANNRYTVYVKNAYFNEEGISRVGFQGSASISINGASQASYNTSWNSFNASKATSFVAYLGGANNNSVISPNDRNFNGYFQEFRYWTSPIPESVFDRHVLNSADYSLDYATGSLFNLIFRAPLGNNLTVPYLDENNNELNAKDYDLYLLDVSTIDPNAVVDTIHPAVSGTFYIPETGQTVVDIKSFFNGPLYGYGLFSADNYRNFVPQEFTDLITSPTVGISQKVNNKVIIEETFTGSYAVERLLDTAVTLQRFDTDRVISSPQLEVAFSPTDLIDEDIIDQLGKFDIDEYIGKPTDRYTIRYRDLDNLQKLYFEKYLKSFNFFDFVRLLKYIDNSLFKMIKDFTPARANLSTGVVIKPHILERPKYPRHEPDLIRYEYTGSIDTAFITASVPQGVEYETAYSMSIMTPSGSTTKYQPNHLAQFTGEYQGSSFEAMPHNSPIVFEQTEVSNVVPINTESLSVNRESWYYVTYSLDPLFNNVTESRRSTQFYDLDYTYNQVLPVNYGLVTQSMYEVSIDNPQYDSPYVPWAQIQDSNYESKVYTIPRYEGSKTISRLYSTYSVGDSSYGKTAAIDKIRNQYAYLVDIYTASLTLPSRSNAQIKYLLDNTENVLDLTKENNNIFEVQNLYKGGEVVNISLFDYTDQSTTILSNKQVELYEGGYRYLPILHNILGTATAFSWSYEQPQRTVTVLPGQGGGTPVDCTTEGNYAKWSNPANYIVDYTTQNISGGLKLLILQNVRYIGGPASDLPTNCNVFVTVSIPRSALNLYMCYEYADPTSFSTYGPFTLNSTSIFSNALNVQIQTECDCAQCSPSTAGGTAVVRAGGITASTPLGQRVTVSNSNAVPVAIIYRGYCDAAPKSYTLPIGTSTICLHFTQAFPSDGGGVTYTPAGTCTDCGVIPPIEFVSYESTGRDLQVCLNIPAQSPEHPEYSNRLIEFSQFISTALYSNTPILFNDLSDPATLQFPIERVQQPFTLAPGDAIHFYSSSLGWSEQEEYRVVTTFYSGSVGSNTTNQRFFAVLDRSINRNILTTQPTSTVDGTVCKFIIAKHIPDETNLILRYNPINPALVENGVVYPQYIQEAVRKNAGNVIKSLKSQGLI